MTRVSRLLDARAVLVAVALVGATLPCACTPAPRAPTVNQPPLPVLAVPSSARVGEPVLIDGEASHDPGGAVSDAHLLFGDGGDPATGLSAEHTWQAPGLYLVELYVVDNEGAAARARARIQITP
ncbi:MAG: PKD domain-containing protein [Deltaproteobacteria bacterium]|nr:PKD domain-containing protein [Deltaproteobacteria bacterium]